MVSVVKTETGYRAHVYVQGKRKSKSFRTSREARSWGQALEHEIAAQAATPAGERVTLAEVLQRYRDEVTPTKRGERNERVRLTKFLSSPSLPLGLPIASVTPEVIAAWRDAELQRIKPGSVIRDLTLLSSVFEHARREWRLIASSPIPDVRRPRSPPHRTVIIGWRQVRRMCRALGYVPGRPVRQVRQAVAVCFLVALRTGMRAGELAGLTWDRVAADHVWLPVTKTDPRIVPLEPRSRALIEQMRGWDDVLVFGFGVSSLDAIFRKYRERAGMEGFTFHDARHTAATRLARRVDVLTLCKIFGWRGTKQALTYYNPTAAQLVAAVRPTRRPSGQSR